MKKILEALFLFAFPTLAFAQQQAEDAATFFNNVKTNVVNPLLELLAVGAFVVFVWGVVDFIRGADDAEKRATGQQHILWGIVGLVIIFGVNTLISILKATFQIQ